MSHWNYRVIKKKNTGQFVDQTEEYSYGIHEVYYHDDGSISSCTVDPMDPYGNTFDELKECMDMMSRALTEPVLDYETDIPSSRDSVEQHKIAELDEIFDGCDAQDGC